MFLRGIFLALALVTAVWGHEDECDTLALTETGWVCGLKRTAKDGAIYASFRGIPYAKQPLGELRFQELQPAEPWDDVLNATTEGPACYQHNTIFADLLQPHGFSESCILVNVHVPVGALPCAAKKVPTTGGLPILVFMHGGGWMSGSGDSDINGPEYLIGKDIIVITFNYRLDVLGFLSLGTAKIPGNAGLRDAVTLLRWVQRNARYFGGNPEEVTLMGQSTGAHNTHLLTLSPAANGLFKRVWTTSGIGLLGFYTSSPLYAAEIATSYLTVLGLNGTDYDTVHDQLVQMPIEQLYNGSQVLIDQGAFVMFMPVQESTFPGITPVLPGDSVTLEENGNGDDIPAVTSYTNNECAATIHRLVFTDAVEKYKENPLTVVPVQWLYTLPENTTANIAAQIGEKYFAGEPTLEKYIQLCSDEFVVYPALKFAHGRAARGAAPVYLQKYSYADEYSVIKKGLNLTYEGATHLDDLAHILKVNSLSVPQSDRDDAMTEWMANLVANYVKTGSPSLNNEWPSLKADSFEYQQVITPEYLQTTLATEDQDIFDFFEGLTSNV